MNKFLLLSNIALLAFACSYLSDNTLILTATPQEIVNIPLNKIFIDQNFTSCRFSEETQQFTLKRDLLSYEVEQNKVDAKVIISQKFQKTSASVDPLHYFSILSKSNDQYHIETNSKQFNKLPEMDISFNVDLGNSICYDFVQIEEDFILDCKDEFGDYFAYINNGTTIQIPIEATVNEERKLDQIDNFIYKSSVDKIELYELQNDDITLIAELDQQGFAVLLEKQDFQLLIRDFKTHTNGYVSIMNAYGHLIVLQYKNAQFELILSQYTAYNNSKAYDYDAYKNTVTVVQEEKLIYLGVDGKLLDINITYAPNDRVYLGKDIIVFQESQKITYYDLKLNFLFVRQIQNINYISVFSPRYNEIFLLDTEYIYQLLYIETPYLRFQQDSISTEKSTQLLQDILLGQCQVTIKYKVVDLESTDIYDSQPNNQLFNDPIFLDDPQAKIQTVYQGPNLQYKISAIDSINFDIKYYKEFVFLNVKTVDVIFQKLIYYQEKSKYYLIQQLKDMEIFGYECIILSNTSQNCTKLFNVKNFIQLQHTVDQAWWLVKDSLHLAAIVNTEVNVYMDFGQQQFIIYDIIKQQAKQLITNSQQLIIVIDEEILIYDAININLPLLSTMSKAEKVFASANYPDIFVYNQNTLSQYNIQNQQQSLIWYQVIEENQDINIAFFENYFIVLLDLNGSKYKAITFNYQNKRNVYQQKQFSFYNYSPLYLNQIETSLQNNLLYLYGIDSETQLNNILVYKIDSLAQDALFTVIATPANIKFSVAQNYLISIDDLGGLMNYYIPLENIVEVWLLKSYKQVNYTLFINQTGNVYNQFKSKKLETIPLQLVNRGNQLFQLQNSFNLTYENKSSLNCVPLTSYWYSGQILNMFQQGESKILYYPTITKMEQTLNFKPVMMEFDSQTLISIYEANIYLISKEKLETTMIMFDGLFTFNYILIIKGEYIFISQNAKYVLGFNLSVFRCKNNECEMQEKYLNYKTEYIYQPKYAYLDGNYLFVAADNQVFVYDTKGDYWNMGEYELIKSFYLSKTSKFIQISHISGSIYSIVSITQTGIVETRFQDIKNKSQDSLKYYDIKEIISQNQQYMTLSANTAGLFLSKENKQLIVVFTTTASFGFNYQPTCNADLECELKNFNMVYIYQQYGYGAVDISYLNNNILSLVYFVKDHCEILLYDVNELSSKLTAPRLAFAGVKQDQQKGTLVYKTVSCVYTYKNQLYLMASTENNKNIQHYQLYTSPWFCIKEEKMEESLTFTLSNSFNQLAVEIKLQIEEKVNPGPDPPGPDPPGPEPPGPEPPGPDPDDPDEKKFSYKWIAIGGGSAVGVVVLGFIICKCCKKNDVGDSFI